MRDVRAADALRRLHTRRADWRTKLNRIALSDVPTIGTVEIPIQSPLTVLAGPNGVGKTTLLRAIWAALEPDVAAERVLATKRLTAGTALVDLLLGEAPESAEVRFAADAVDVTSRSNANVHHIDSAAHTPNYQTAFCAFDSAEEIVNGAGPRELDAKALAEVSYITRRAYRSVTLYEVEMDGAFPFFEVSYGNDTYDSRTMGAGEMAALYIWWAVRRADPDSVLLIEEPEAFLSFGCQQSLANFIIAALVENRLVAIITSHSAAFISPLPKESLVFLSRGQAGVAISQDAPPVLLKTMGITPPVAAYVFVEDSMGRLFLRLLLERLDPLLSRQIYIDQRNGDGELRAALKPMLNTSGPIKFVGMFDGDLRNGDLGDLASQSSFLPGERAVEIIFRDMVAASPASLEAVVHNAHVSTIVASLEGKDHHDWYEELARELGLSRDQLFIALFSIWIQIPANEEAAQKTYSALLNLVNP